MDPNLPATPPAQPVVAPQTPTPDPVTPPADGNPAPKTDVFESLEEEDRNYLKSQGVTELNDESFKKLLKHNISLRKTAAQPQTPANPQSPATGDPSTTPATPAPEQPQPPKATGLDPVTALNLATSLGIQFPELASQLSDGSFYTEMNELGIPTTDANGGVNLNGILSYGKRAQEDAKLRARVAELEKPDPNNIPDANATTPKVVDANTAMSLDAARSIVMSGDVNNARFAEAAKFIQDNAK